MPQRRQIGALVHRGHHRPIRSRWGEADRGLVGFDDLHHLGRRCVFQQRRRRPESQRKDRKAAETEREGQRRRADENILRRDIEDFPCIAIRDDHEIAMEMHRRLGFTRSARGKPQQGHVIAAGLDRIEPDRLVQCYTIELGIVVRRAIEIHDLLEKPAGLGARDQFVGDAAVGQRQRNLGLVDDFCQFAGAKHWHRVDDDGARFCGSEPRRDQSRIIARTDQNPVAGFDAVILDQRVR